MGIDSAAINGSGAAGQPTGLLNTSGLGFVSGTSLGYTGLVEAQVDLSNSNAIVNPDALGYLTTPLVAQTLKGRQRFTGTDSPLWQGAIHEGEIEGVPALSTKQMPADTMLYADWSQLVVPEWGNLAVETNPFADFRAGIIGIRAMWSIDIIVRHAESFTKITAIT